MEQLSSLNILSRKRKKNSLSSANRSVSIFTRSKSQLHVHQPDAIPEKSPPIVVNSDYAWRVSSIKDLRARRVFSPEINSILEEQNKRNMDKEKKLSKGLGGGRGSDPVLNMGLGDVKVDGSENCDKVLSSKMEEFNGNSSENGLDLKDVVISGNSSISKSRMALNLCTRKNIFKTPGSFSFRRLLPYLKDIVNDSSNHTKLCENEVAHSFQPGLPCNQGDLSGVKDDLDERMEDIGLHKMEQKSCANVVSGVDVSMEENSVQMTPPDPDIFANFVQMTPPDPDIFARTEILGSVEDLGVNTLLTENHICKTLSAGSAVSNNISVGRGSNGKHDSVSMNSLVLKPCTRLRVFGNRQSVSYRRLLPFLTEISNHDSSTSRIVQQQKPMVDLKEKLHPLSAATSVEHNHVKKIRTGSSYEKQHFEEMKQDLLLHIDPPLAVLSEDTSADPSSSMPVPSSTINSSNVESNSVASENANSQRASLDFVTAGKFQSQTSPRKLGPERLHNDINDFESNENCSAVPPFSTVNHDILTEPCTSLVTEPEPVSNRYKCLDVKLEVHNDSSKSIEKVHLDHDSSKIKVCDTFVSAIDVSSKGILKKNPRGCKGPCNCLNCASFRLHAERAYEFSRNQMHDAEEVAAVLMKELAKLRYMLEKSIVNENNPAFIPLNPIRVKQACTEALETEKIAKERLSQLYCDLNIHCRIPALLQPRVTFSNCIQERTLQLLDPPINTE